MWGSTQIRILDPKQQPDILLVKNFLAPFDLTFEENVSYLVALYNQERLIGTGALHGNILRNIAVLPEYQGDGLTAIIVTHLIQELSRRGIFHYFIFTKPSSAKLFVGLGFKEVARAEPHAVLLEAGIYSIEEYCREVRAAATLLPPGNRAAIVVNCNPFTHGHRALIETAAQENAAVIVFVVSEDSSVVPVDVRYRLVKDGVSDLKNVIVVETKAYSVSRVTFPAYFIPAAQLVTAQTRLDAMVFATRIAPELKIGVRYVGQEPGCAVTAAYNQALAQVLPQHGIRLKEIERVCYGNEYISASKVRELIRHDCWEQIAELVPAVTYQYLQSAQAEPVIKHLKAGTARHGK